MFDLLNEYLTCPEIYTSGKANFWQDEYISEKLLETHLDQNTDLASRKLGFIDTSVEWIAKIAPPAKYPRLLDVGCGPGLYAQRFAKAGYNVTGVDFSKRSVEYARSQAIKNHLPITYLHQNYLELKLNDTSDIAVMIYCDYGALSAENRTLLMDNIYKRLRPGGRFILDVCSVKEYEQFEESRTWEYCGEGGFWSPEKYYCFNINKKYQDFTALHQAVVVTQNKTSVYYIWNHCFTKETLTDEAVRAGFNPLEVFSDIAGQPYSEDSKTIAVVLEK